MAHAASRGQVPGFAENDEVVQSIRTINRQRNTKLFLAVFGILAALAALMLAIGLAYNSELEAVKDLPAQAR